MKKDGEDWWENVMGFLKRPYRLVSVQAGQLLTGQNRDDLEDAELETSQISEGMPMGMTGFKDHPLYVALGYTADPQATFWNGILSVKKSFYPSVKSGGLRVNQSIVGRTSSRAAQLRTGCGSADRSNRVRNL